MGFNSFEKQTEKDTSKNDLDERNESCQHSSVLEPNIIFYQQPIQSKLNKVLDDLTFTDESETTPRTMPTVSMTKVDSETFKEEVIFKADRKLND